LNNDTPVPGGAILALAFSPLTLIDGLRSWILGDRPDASFVPDTGALGTAYVIMFIVLLGVSVLALVWRYRTVSVS